MLGFLKLIEKQCLKQKEKSAIILGSDSISYKSLYEQVISVANYLVCVQKNTKHIFIRAKYCISYWVAYLASILCGAAVVPIDSSLPLTSIEEIFGEDFDNSLIITDSVNDNICRIVCYEEIERARTLNLCSPISSFSDFDDDHLTHIVFTTGSTGQSKGVGWSYTCYRSFGQAHDSMPFTEDTIIGMVSSIPHSFTYGPLTNILFHGGTYVYFNGLKDIESFYKFAKLNRINSLAILPSAMAYLMATSLNELKDLSKNIIFIDLSGEKLNKKTQEDLIKIFKNARMFNAYGSTEATLTGVYEFSKYGVSEGRIKDMNTHPYVEFFDSDGEIIKPTLEHPGLIGVKLEFDYLGYCHDINPISSYFNKGYYVTSDLGFVDEDNFLCLVGRNNDVIHSGGYKINPTEIEEVILSSNMVEDCICYGKENEIFGQILALDIVPKKSFIEKYFNYFLIRNFEKHKIPKIINQVDEIKKNRFGKKDRKHYRG